MLIGLLAVAHGQAWGQAVRETAGAPTNGPATELVLTGIVELPGSGVKRAFIEAGAGPHLRCHSLGEGQRSGDVEVVKIESGKAVTVRYRGELVELAFVAPAQRENGLRRSEQEKDISHTHYHAQRARLDRERDRLERRKAN